MMFSPQTIWTALESLLQPATLWTVAIRGVLLLAAAGLIVRIAFRASAASRHLIWTMAMLALLLLPLLSSTLPDLQVRGPAWLAAHWGAAARSQNSEAPPAGRVSDESLNSRTLQRSPSSGVLLQEQAAADEVARDGSSGTTPGARSGSQVASRALATTRVADGPHRPVAGGTTRFAPVQTDAAPDTARSPAGWLLPLWLVGLVGVAGWFTLQHWSVRWLTMHAVEVEEGELVDLLHRLRRHIELRRPVRLLMGHRTMMPMTWGIFRPVLLLPDNVEQWPASRREDVLLHELAHIKRRDHLSQVVAQLACALHWFNPLTWYAVRRMTLEREHACDDYVLNSGTRPSDYATNLLEVARSMKRGPVTSMAAIAMAGRSTLKDRLQAVLDEGRTRNTLGGRLTAIALLLVAAVAVPLATLEVVTVEDVQAAGPKVGERSRAPRAIGSGDPMVMVHDGRVIELPPVDSDEVLAILQEQLDGLQDRQVYENSLENFRRFGEELGMGFRELEGDPDTDFHYFAFDTDAQEALQSRLEDLSDSFSGLSVFVQPGGGSSWSFQMDSDDVVAPRAPRAPRPPMPPRPSVRVTVPRINVGPFEIADGTWGFHSKGKNNWTWNDGDDRMSLRTRGEVTFNEDGTDVESLSPNGYFELDTEDGNTDYRVRFRAERDGTIERTWWVDGDKHEYDDEAKKWMAKAMPDLMRRTGFNAESRVRSILEKDGVDGVLDEIDSLDSDHVIRIYFNELLKQARLDNDQYKRVFEKAGDAIDSDFELASLLAAAAEATDLDENAVVQYARATSQINSDFEHRRALTPLVTKQKLTSKGIEAVLQAAQGMNSDFELASFLTELAEQYPESCHSPLFLDALATVGSDFEQRRVLSSVVTERDLSEDNLARALEMAAEGIHSDFELAELLTTTARVHSIQGKAVQPFLDGLATLDSDFEFRRAATSVLYRGEFDKASVAEMLRLAERHVNSDFELAQLLQAVAENYEVEGDLREAYLDATNSIQSRHESRRVLSAIGAASETR